MPPKKTSIAGHSASVPSKSGRQRTLTNKQQQLRKRAISLVATLISFGLLVAQKTEKEGAAKQRALTDAIRAEQRNEEINGFYKAKQPGNR
jgi:hypothetical protein